MKKIGIIGGAGPLASALLLEYIVHECYNQGCQNETAFPEIVLLNHPFSITLCTQQDENNCPMICNVLQACCDRLVCDGAQLLAVACNTFHLFVSELSIGTAQLISIAHVTQQEAERQKLSRLLVLGTPLTLYGSLYKHPTIECIVPLESDLAMVEAIINRILTGSVLKKDAELLDELIVRLRQEYVFDGVVLGCTELPVLHKKHPLANNAGLAILDTLAILAKNIVLKAQS